MRTLAVSRIRSERTGIKVQVVGGIVTVDVGVFENVGLHAEHTEMANGTVNHLWMPVAKVFSKLRPSLSGVE